MKRVQDKLKLRIRELSKKEDEMNEMQQKLDHLQHVQTIIDGEILCVFITL